MGDNITDWQEKWGSIGIKQETVDRFNKVRPDGKTQDEFLNFLLDYLKEHEQSR